MSTNTYVALKTYTIPSTQATYTFDLTGITGYTDLFIEVAGRTTYSAEVNYWMQFNNDGGTGSLYSTTRLQGNGSSPASNRTANAGVGYIGYVPGANDASGVYSASSIHIMNYSNSTTYKTSICRSSLPEYAAAFVSLWRNTNAIQYITLGCDAGSWAAGSTFTIYGIANADVGAYATGGIITQDANYYYHAFGSSSTFTPTRNLTADILVVAGGGGGGGAHGGGGGAGGLIVNSTVSLANGTGYTCTIGSGGAGSSTSAAGTNGTNSNVTGGSLSLTAAVGGGGGGTYSGTGTSAGSNGGSGGGGSNYPGNTVYSGGTATSGQGNAGGNSSGNQAGGGGGGGGGSGAVGAVGVNQGTLSQGGGQGGAGGAGVNTYSSWLSATGLGVSGYIAGGGGGGSYSGPTYTTYVASAGGSGGGGNGGYVNSSYTPQASVAGTANTGSGGGGGSGNGGTGSSGGSGLIIVRYSK